ncbi:MAG: hypothetical protein D6772_09185, partial [Bacteroidetes bacterium]
GPTTTRSCDDGNASTINDMEVVLDCDGSICEPCMGVICNLVVEVQGPTIPIRCDQVGSGDPVVLNATTSGGSGELIYQWLLGGTPIADAQEESLEITQEGEYELVVTDENGCIASSQLEIAFAEADLSPTLRVLPESCSGFNDGSIAVDTVVGGQAPYLLSLDGQAFVASNIFAGLSPGNYQLRIQDVNGCEVELEVTVPSGNSIFVDIQGQTRVQIGEELSLFFITNATEVDSIVWQLDSTASCLDCRNPVVRPVENTTYTVQIIDSNGCVAFDEVAIQVDRRVKVYFPNAFSPNGDDVNDTFRPFFDPDVIKISSFRIFDRWGASVYDYDDQTPNTPTPAWDGFVRGEKAPSGVYLFAAEVEYIDGTIEVLSGEVLLLR